MTKQQILSLVRSIQECPTAPFHEDVVADLIRSRLDGLPNVTLRRDEFGSLIASYKNGRSRPLYAFAAHMDHPGWVRSDEGEWEFLGGVPESYRKDPKIIEFGPLGMWALPAFEIENGRIYSRACDDLIGCAAIVATFHTLAKAGARACFQGVFTRAEEVGMIGAIKLAKAAKLPKRITVVSLETSAERPPAKMGDGPIIRVGDRTSVFDSAATAALTRIATASKIPHQRALMPGGTCEATAYQLYGYRTTGIAIALGNYHNCGPETKIAPEFVSIDDVHNLVKLCVAVAKSTEDPAGAPRELRKKLEANLEKYRRYF